MSNIFYNYTSGVPNPAVRGVSSSLRTEFAAIGAGFDAIQNQILTSTLPALPGNAGKVLTTDGSSNVSWVSVLANFTISNSTFVNPALGTPASGVLTNCTTSTAAVNDNSTALANTAFVNAERANSATLTNKALNWANNSFTLTSAQLIAALTDETGSGSAVFSISPTFTGVPAVPTAAPGTSSTQAASTAFVAISYAPLASPAFTGNPTAPTQSLNDSSTKIASTAFVMNQFSGGTIAAGRYKFTASGAIGQGDVVVLNSNATVSTVASLASAGAIGAKAAFNAVNPTTILQVVSVPGTSTVIILYNENGTIKLVAGTAVGGSTNTFAIGAPITAPTNTAITSFSMTWNVTEGVLVLTYINTTMYAVTVTLTGTTLFANTPNNSTVTPNSAYTCCEYNTAQNKTLVACISGGGFYTFQSLTISGAVFSWGTAIFVGAGVTTTFPSSAVQIAGTSVVAIAFSNSTAAVPVIHLVSINAAVCTSVQSYSTTSYFSAASQIIKLGYHQAAGFLFAGSSLGTAFTGKTSGSTMTNLASATFGSMTKIHGFSYDTTKNNLIVTGADVNNYAAAANLNIVSNASVATNYTTINGTASASVVGAYNAAQDRMVIALQDQGNLNYGTTRVWQTGTTSADQWVGIAQAAIADTAIGWVWTIGGYCDALTGLTVGVRYYLDDSGSLQTTGTRLIGTAYATNRLFITGNP